MSTSNRIITVLAFALVAHALAGCGSAHLVRADRHGGRVALDGAYMERVADARLLMASHCEGRFTILTADGHGAVDAPAPDQETADFECETDSARSPLTGVGELARATP
jgi:hypothetical protein